ncbi:hypothetical protein AMAG_16666 [Allomyces macrogynus ATCC 38327]|uniref:Glycoside hydrolase family 19 catalytic domain-containing protein n=1 Tax=Allomyces macrogynus (strain ATCC 38327) TaxID=578462 RepID=A0A0L0TCA5_ALLM3|nr:hypothetical protein AMAG_16666 [Allomyces macrogynus ATCC 38327]|eukprot:KNE72179.1 hypothetical protein AMAG_16666 [Allomyces macrogynus ATCC 38327]
MTPATRITTAAAAGPRRPASLATHHHLLLIFVLLTTLTGLGIPRAHAAPFTWPTVGDVAPPPECTIATDAALSSVLDASSRDTWPHLRKAAVQYGLCTPARLAVYLATMSHETAGLTVLYQPKTGGRGAIMMVPANWHYAFVGLGDSSLASRLDGDLERTDQVAADAMMDPTVTFRVAAWWFRGGAATVGMKAKSDSDACNDLAVVADALPADFDANEGKAHSVLATINECVAGNGDADPGFAQRVALTNKAMRAIQGK